MSIEDDIKNIGIIEISNIKELPDCWMRSYTLTKDSSISICYNKYKDRYNHEPVGGWIFTNSKGQKTLYFKINDSDK